MNVNRLLLLPLGLMSGLMLSSCIYPYPPNQHNPLVATSPDPAASGATVDSDYQESVREARDRVREEGLEANTNEPSPEPRNSEGPAPTKDYRTAVPIPGKEGFVFNPFTNEPVNVQAIPPGTLVRDPNDPNPDHKFRVP